MNLPKSSPSVPFVNAETQPGAEGALHGVRVIDLTSVLMGPFATQLLADMGADVIKVEPPSGDTVRGIGPMKNPGMGYDFLQVNRNKRSLVLDLKQPDGIAALLRLIDTADVLAYNVRPQAMARLGLTWARLSERGQGSHDGSGRSLVGIAGNHQKTRTTIGRAQR